MDENLEVENQIDNTSNSSGSGALRWTIVFFLVVAILVLLSIINHNSYYISDKNGSLTISQGMWLPYGTQQYTPKDEFLQKLYSPIPLPAIPGYKLECKRLGDSAAIDLYLFTVLSEIMDNSLTRKAMGDTAGTTAVLSRMEMIPQLSEDRLNKIKSYKSENEYFSGVKLIISLSAIYNEALTHFKNAQELESNRGDIPDWISKLENYVGKFIKDGSTDFGNLMDSQQEPSIPEEVEKEDNAEEEVPADDSANTEENSVGSDSDTAPENLEGQKENKETEGEKNNHDELKNAETDNEEKPNEEHPVQKQEDAGGEHSGHNTH